MSAWARDHSWSPLTQNVEVFCSVLTLGHLSGPCFLVFKCFWGRADLPKHSDSCHPSFVCVQPLLEKTRDLKLKAPLPRGWRPVTTLYQEDHFRVQTCCTLVFLLHSRLFSRETAESFLLPSVLNGFAILAWQLWSFKVWNTLFQAFTVLEYLLRICFPSDGPVLHVSCCLPLETFNRLPYRY